jgi:energy-coupling factor transporter ATP-binding protein EcfA2
MVKHRNRIIAKSLLICGESGSGKSHLLKFIRRNIRESRSLNILKFLADLEAGKSDYIRQILDDFSDGIVLIDDLDLLPEQAISSLTSHLQKLQDFPVLMIATSRIPTFSLPFALEALFPTCVTINSLSADQRRLFILSITSYPEKKLDKIVKATAGLTRGELSTICEIFLKKTGKLSVGKLTYSLVLASRPLVLSGTNLAVCGYHKVMDELRLFIKVTLNQSSTTLIQQKGVLLHGPSGNGKSLMIRKLSDEFNIPFFILEFERIFSRYLGESEKSIRDVFNSARFFSPCVIVIENLDAIASKRNDESGVGGRVLSTLLNELDGISKNAGVLTIAATNALKLVDSALLRPGRFDLLLEVENPSFEERKEMFEEWRKKTPVCGDVESDWLAALCEGMSCAEVKSFFRISGLQALHDGEDSVSRCYFEMGLEKLQKRKSALSFI